MIVWGLNVLSLNVLMDRASLISANDNIAKQAVQWTPQGHRGRTWPTKTGIKRSGQRNVDSWFQVEQAKDRDGNTRKCWI